MLILLPPSEGKRPGGRGRPVDLDALSFPGLTDARRDLLDVVVPLCADPDKGRAALGLSEALDPDRAATAAVLTAPTMPAGRRYAGVLFDALDYPSLAGPALRRANASLVIASALWGATRPADRLPAYRLGIDADLPGIGPLATYWRRRGLPAELHAAVAKAGGAFDLRSSGYVPAWRPGPDDGVVTVALRTAGGGAVPSYNAKYLKGQLVRELLATGPVTVDSLLAACDTLGVKASRDGHQIVVVAG